MPPYSARRTGFLERLTAPETLWVQAASATKYGAKRAAEGNAIAVLDEPAWSRGGQQRRHRRAHQRVSTCCRNTAQGAADVLRGIRGQEAAGAFFGDATTSGYSSSVSTPEARARLTWLSTRRTRRSPVLVVAGSVSGGSIGVRAQTRCCQLIHGDAAVAGQGKPGNAQFCQDAWLLYGGNGPHTNVQIGLLPDPRDLLDDDNRHLQDGRCRYHANTHPMAVALVTRL